eukprot:TRINITY_DN897_c0_g1_i1.p1 TRINITY_DN897_c0_g1~~TRINITY_DN897_c0_g1_i1.p1  ORF type:complete len:169 (+),score=0.63 TRINITY_DN897_c0_g1_i1:43-549(+)
MYTASTQHRYIPLTDANVTDVFLRILPTPAVRQGSQLRTQFSGLETCVKLNRHCAETALKHILVYHKQVADTSVFQEILRIHSRGKPVCSTVLHTAAHRGATRLYHKYGRHRFELARQSTYPTQTDRNCRDRDKFLQVLETPRSVPMAVVIDAAFMYQHNHNIAAGAG